MGQQRVQAAVDITSGIDKSRRVAWAKYYALLEDNQKLVKLNIALIDNLAEIIIIVLENEAVNVLDPEGELALKAISVYGSMLRTTKGKDAVERIQKEREAKKTADNHDQEVPA